MQALNDSTNIKTSSNEHSSTTSYSKGDFSALHDLLYLKSPSTSKPKVVQATLSAEALDDLTFCSSVATEIHKRVSSKAVLLARSATQLRDAEARKYREAGGKVDAAMKRTLKRKADSDDVEEPSSKRFVSSFTDMGNTLRSGTRI